MINVNELAKEYPEIPRHMWDGVDRYVNKGITPGGFLTHIFSNELVQAFSQADSSNSAAMESWARLLYNDLPWACWGSRDIVATWPGLETKAPKSAAAHDTRTVHP